MYSRRNGEQVFSFEPSGGLLNASLVMRDRETDSYWSILTDQAIYGEARGQNLRQLSGSAKMTFGEWKKRHPETLVLSVEGVEHEEKNPYDRYFTAAEGFRGLGATDTRLEDKADIFGMHHGGKAWAVPHPIFRQGGAVVELDGRQLFLYRLEDDVLYRGTVAYFLNSATAVRKSDGWRLEAAEGRKFPFDPESRSFPGAGALTETASGFDTFWYIWSLTNPETELVSSPGS